MICHTMFYHSMTSSIWQWKYIIYTMTYLCQWMTFLTKIRWEDRTTQSWLWTQTKKTFMTWWLQPFQLCWLQIQPLENARLLNFPKTEQDSKNLQHYQIQQISNHQVSLHYCGNNKPESFLKPKSKRRKREPQGFIIVFKNCFTSYEYGVSQSEDFGKVSTITHYILESLIYHLSLQLKANFDELDAGFPKSMLFNEYKRILEDIAGITKVDTQTLNLKISSFENWFSSRVKNLKNQIKTSCFFKMGLVLFFSLTVHQWIKMVGTAVFSALSANTVSCVDVELYARTKLGFACFVQNFLGRQHGWKVYSFSPLWNLDKPIW